MKPSMESKRVTWAPGPNLCQVKLFQSEDGPSRVGIATQHHRHQSNTSISNIQSFDKKFLAWYVSPSMDKYFHVNSPKEELGYIPQIKWKCPPAFSLDPNWQVAAAEESKEVEAQKDRERKVLEAVYPRFSAMLPSTSISSDEEDQCLYNDNQVPVIPTEEVVDEETETLASDVAIIQAPSTFATHNISTCTMNTHPPSLSQRPSTFATSTISQTTTKLQPPCLSLGPFTSGAFSIPQRTINSQPPFLTQCPSTSLSNNLPQCNMNSQPPSLSLGSSTSASAYIPHRATKTHPPSLAFKPSMSSTSTLLQSTVKSQPPSLSLGPSSSTTLHMSHYSRPDSQNPPASEKSSVLDDLHSKIIDVVASAAAAIAKSNEQGSLIDTGLLVKFLSAPKMTEKLMREHGIAPNTKTTITNTEVVSGKSIKEQGTEATSTSFSGRHSLPFTCRKPQVLHVKAIEDHVRPHSGVHSKTLLRPVIPPPFPGKLSEKHGEKQAGTSHIMPVQPVVPPPVIPNVERIKKLINEYGAPENNGGQKSVPSSKSDFVVSPVPNLYNTRHYSPSSYVHTSGLKDKNEFKSLIKQHGNRNLSEYGKAHNLQDLKPTARLNNHNKPCMFFNSSRGCRNGSNCPYLHDDSSKLSRPGHVLEPPVIKRVKPCWEDVGGHESKGSL